MTEQYAYEKLGLFYLGKEVDLKSSRTEELPYLYRNKDLTTHGVIIGMTGSGKTGLGIALVEEAIMDGIPSIIIDPKGDMGNLLLTFPSCTADDFSPWVDPAEAGRKGKSVPEYAADLANTWKQGLAAWGQGLERIASLREKSELVIYTPGSSAGAQVSILGDFGAPAEEVLADQDTLNSLVASTASSLLGLAGIAADPLQSREHILLSSLLLHFWRQGEDLSMESLIGAVVSPPFSKVGVFPLDTFYPQNQRMALAMTLNNIVASPTFSSWLQGDPLDIQRILYNTQGKPRTAIFSIAHLSDSERMFFVTTLLNRLIGWMRRQQGASTLKALLYMDEIFGYFPPTASPPSKKPMLLLLKQARAFGVGVVLATQNPVDLDYKGLANMGSWFVGRLQTRQDQERVVEGIAGASDGKLDAAQVREMLANLKSRQFLLNCVHNDAPLLFETRWVMSYLRGPISQADIKRLMSDHRSPQAFTSGEGRSEARTEADTDSDFSAQAPLLPQAIEQRYLLQNVVAEQVRLQPWLAADASVRFCDNKRSIDTVEKLSLQLPLEVSFRQPQWEMAEEAEVGLEGCLTIPPLEASYAALPAEVSRLKDLRELERNLADYLYQNKRLTLFRFAGTKIESLPGESEVDFRIRFSDQLREEKEAELEKLRQEFAKKQDRLEKKLVVTQGRLEKEQGDVQARTADSLLSFGAAVLGAFLGRKAVSASTIGKAVTGIRGVGRVAKEKGDVSRAQEAVAMLEEDMQQLGFELEDRAKALEEKYLIENYSLETFSIKPRRSDIFDLRLAILWRMIA